MPTLAKPEVDRKTTRKHIGADLYILENCRIHENDTLGIERSYAMRELGRNELRPLTYQEALINAKLLIKTLGGGKDFAIDGVLPELKDDVYRFNEQGDITEPSGKEVLNPDLKVDVRKGEFPLTFSVCDPDNDFRFVIAANKNPYPHEDLMTNGVSVVIGVKADRTQLTQMAKSQKRK